MMKKTMLKRFACLLAACLLLTTLSVAASAEEILSKGTYGPGSYYSLTADGTLSLWGTGRPNAVTANDYPWHDYRDRITRVELRDGLEIISREFLYGVNIPELTIPDSVTTIEYSAFAGLSGVKELVIPAGVTDLDTFGYSIPDLERIDYYCPVKQFDRTLASDKPNLREINFYNDDSDLINVDGVIYSRDMSVLYLCPQGRYTESFTVPDSVKKIDWFAFEDHTELCSVELNEGLEVIDRGFVNCDGLKTVSLPSTVKQITFAFSWCDGLESVYFADHSDIDNMENAFAFCPKLSLVDFGENSCIDEIGEKAFEYCPSLESITIPDSVKTIRGAFYAAGLTEVNIPANVETIEAGAFNCPNLQSVSFAPGCRLKVLNRIFNNSRIETIVLPDGLEEIGDNAFSEMAVTEITIPSGVRKIGKYAFNYCNALTSLAIPAAVEEIGTPLFSYSGVEEITVAPENPYFMSENGMLFNKDQTVLICCPTKTALTEYVIPDTVRRIEDYAFYRCDSITNLYPFDNVEDIGISALPAGFIRSLTDIENGVLYLGKFAVAMKSRPENNTVVLREGTEKVLPYFIDYDMFGITSVVIPDSLKGIGEMAFGTSRVQEIVIGENSQLETIGSKAFTGGRFANLDFLNKTKVSVLESYVFGYVTDKEIRLPDQITELKFSSIPAGTEKLTFGENSRLEKIGSRAFPGICINKLPDSVRVIADNGLGNVRFDNDTVILPKNLEYIGDFALENVYPSSIIMHDKVKHIGSNLLGDVIGLNIYVKVTFIGCDKQWQNIEWGTDNDKLINCNDITFLPDPGELTVSNAVAPDCTHSGYSGDVYCTVCGELLERGTTIPAGHVDADGDNICDVCGRRVAVQTVITKIIEFFNRIIDFFRNLFR